jgi:putative nucleotidyltransferase with HDIG domain
VTLPELLEWENIETSLWHLLDKLCVALRKSTPYGLGTWAEREATKVGSAAVMHMMVAASRAISDTASRYPHDFRRLEVELEGLAKVVERGATMESPLDPRVEERDRSPDVLLAMLAERDAVTHSHAKATAVWARRLAAAVGLNAAEESFVGLCGLLHDIGKVSTPEAILSKRGPLTPEEWIVMKDHSAASGRILERVPSLRRCAEVVRAHHEAYDGGGYPDGLSGDDIPFESRIVAVADSFNAMISDRPYRAAILPRDAMRILEEGKGKKWDPRVVGAIHGVFAQRDAIKAQNKPRLVGSA